MSENKLKSLFDDAIKYISENHRKIIDDWCKAYLAKEYELGNDIHPGSFSIIQQPSSNPLELGYTYRLEKNTEFGWQPIETVPINKEILVYGFECEEFNESEKKPFISVAMKHPDGPFIYQKMCSVYESIHWMPLPSYPIKKHNCEISLIKCTDSGPNSLCVTDLITNNVFGVFYCPICGERA